MAEPYVVGEVVGLRTGTSKAYRRSDGSYLTFVGTRPVHYQDIDGNWHNVQTDLVDEADFDAEEAAGRPVAAHVRDAFRARAAELRAHRRAGGAVNRDQTAWCVLRAPHDVRLPKNLKRGYSIGHGADRLTFIPTAASPSRGELSPGDPATVEYQDVWPLTDVLLTVTPHGLKETLVVKAAGGPTTYSTEVQGGLTNDLTCGTLHVHRAWLIDAAGTGRDVPTVRAERDGRVYVDMTPDYTGLVFPVRIDPTTTFRATVGTDDGTVRLDALSGTKSVATGNTTLDLRTSWDGTVEDYNYTRPVLRLDTSAVTGQITGAQFRVEMVGKSSAYDPIAIDWINPGVAIDATDYDSPAQAAAYSGTATDTQNMPSSGTYTFALANTGSISRTGVSGLRLRFPNGTGTQEKRIEFAAYEHATLTEPLLIITSTAVPSAPNITSPTGGETWNASHTSTWAAATDADTPQASLQYQVQLSTDNQVTWIDLVALTAAGATSAAVDLSAQPESSTCFVRVRAYDGASYGPWDVSDGAFTIAHNQAPLAPTNLSPNGGQPLDRAQVKRLSWTHQDLNSGDPQSRFDLQWSSDGVAWNTVTQVTTNQYWDAPAGTFPRATILWTVRTYDQADLSGPYSAQASFYAGDAPAKPTLISPTDGGTVTVSQPTVQWSSAGQTGYQARALRQDGTVHWDSGQVASGNKAVTIPAGSALDNDIAYTFDVKITNADQLWSPQDSALATVSFTPPPVPEIGAAGNGQTGYIELTVTNPASSGTEPAVASNDLYRRPQGAADWVRIATEIPVNGTYRDYAVASDVDYEYRARAQGANTTYADSLTAGASVTLRGVWLHDVADPAGTVLQLTRAVSRAEDWQPEAALLRPAGRALPVAEFGEQAESGYQVEVILRTVEAQWPLLRALVRRKATLCARDSSGRRLFGVILSLPEKDQVWQGQTVTLSLTETDYSEEV